MKKDKRPKIKDQRKRGEVRGGCGVNCVMVNFKIGIYIPLNKKAFKKQYVQ